MRYIRYLLVLLFLIVLGSNSLELKAATKYDESIGVNVEDITIHVNRYTPVLDLLTFEEDTTVWFNVNAEPGPWGSTYSKTQDSTLTWKLEAAELKEACNVSNDIGSIYSICKKLEEDNSILYFSYFNRGEMVYYRVNFVIEDTSPVELEHIQVKLKRDIDYSANSNYSFYIVVPETVKDAILIDAKSELGVANVQSECIQEYAEGTICEVQSSLFPKCYTNAQVLDSSIEQEYALAYHDDNNALILRKLQFEEVDNIAETNLDVRYLCTSEDNTSFSIPNSKLKIGVGYYQISCDTSNKVYEAAYSSNCKFSDILQHLFNTISSEESYADFLKEAGNNKLTIKHIVNGVGAFTYDLLFYTDEDDSSSFCTSQYIGEREINWVNYSTIRTLSFNPPMDSNDTVYNVDTRVYLEGYKRAYIVPSTYSTKTKTVNVVIEPDRIVKGLDASLYSSYPKSIGEDSYYNIGDILEMLQTDLFKLKLVITINGNTSYVYYINSRCVDDAQVDVVSFPNYEELVQKLGIEDSNTVISAKTGKVYLNQDADLVKLPNDLTLQKLSFNNLNLFNKSGAREITDIKESLSFLDGKYTGSFSDDKGNLHLDIKESISDALKQMEDYSTNKNKIGLLYDPRTEKTYYWSTYYEVNTLQQLWNYYTYGWLKRLDCSTEEPLQFLDEQDTSQMSPAEFIEFLNNCYYCTEIPGLFKMKEFITGYNSFSGKSFQVLKNDLKPIKGNGLFFKNTWNDFNDIKLPHLECKLSDYLYCISSYDQPLTQTTKWNGNNASSYYLFYNKDYAKLSDADKIDVIGAIYEAFDFQDYAGTFYKWTDDFCYVDVCPDNFLYADVPDQYNKLPYDLSSVPTNEIVLSNRGYVTENYESKFLKESVHDGVTVSEHVVTVNKDNLTNYVKGEELDLNAQTAVESIVSFEGLSSGNDINQRTLFPIEYRNNCKYSTVLNEQSAYDLYHTKGTVAKNYRTYCDYKLATLVVAGTPDAVQDIAYTADSSEITWTKPIDQGLGLGKDNEPKFDDTVYVDHYNISIYNKADVTPTLKKTLRKAASKLLRVFGIKAYAQSSAVPIYKDSVNATKFVLPSSLDKAGDYVVEIVPCNVFGEGISKTIIVNSDLPKPQFTFVDAETTYITAQYSYTTDITIDKFQLAIVEGSKTPTTWIDEEANIYQYVFNGLTPNREYTIYVRAVKGEKTSEYDSFAIRTKALVTTITPTKMVTNDVPTAITTKIPTVTLAPTVTDIVIPTVTIAPTATIAPTVTDAVITTVTVEPTATAIPAPTEGPTVTLTSTATVVPTEVVTLAPTLTDAVIPTVTLAPTEGPTATLIPTEVVIPTEAVTPTEMVAPTETVTPTEVVTPVLTEQPIQTVNIEGFVKYSDNTPVSKKVIALDENYTVTDTSGYYRIDDVCTGRYSYRIYNDMNSLDTPLAECSIEVCDNKGVASIIFQSNDVAVETDEVVQQDVIEINVYIAISQPTLTVTPKLGLITRDVPVTIVPSPTMIEPSIEVTPKLTNVPVPTEASTIIEEPLHKPTTTPTALPSPTVSKTVSMSLNVPGYNIEVSLPKTGIRGFELIIDLLSLLLYNQL